MKLTSKEARELARWFRDISTSLDDYLDKHTETIPIQKQKQIEECEARLRTLSSIIITFAVQITLDQVEASYEKIKESTLEAKRAIKTLQNYKKVINIGTAAIELAGAIISKDLGAIGKNAKILFNIANESVKK